MHSERAPIIRLCDKVDDVRYDTAEEVICWVGEAMTPGGVWESEGFRPTSLVVIAVDETGGKYHAKVRPSAMKTSEILSLLEVAKHMQLRRMVGE